VYEFYFVSCVYIMRQQRVK